MPGKTCQKAGKRLKRPSQKLMSKKIRTSLSRNMAHVLEPVPEQYAFYLKNGGVLRNLTELIEALDSMPEHAFSYHANHEKNDFSSWIMDVINEPQLAGRICGKSREAAKNEIQKFLENRGVKKCLF